MSSQRLTSRKRTLSREDWRNTDWVSDALADDAHRDRLTNIRNSLAQTAVSIDYESESAFNTAFKRVMAGQTHEISRSVRGAS
jgi:AraC-like DNA-binding protein